MKLFSAITAFLSLFVLAIALPTEPSNVATEQELTSLAASPVGTLARRIDLCSPKCKKEADAWQSCIWIPYCRDSRDFNNKQKVYDDCCKVANWTPPSSNKPNEILEKLHSILDHLSVVPEVKPGGA
ncbi:hypothetical protein ACJBU6_07754 [Exserohilum turcicum]